MTQPYDPLDLFGSSLICLNRNIYLGANKHTALTRSPPLLFTIIISNSEKESSTESLATTISQGYNSKMEPMLSFGGGVFRLVNIKVDRSYAVRVSKRQGGSLLHFARLYISNILHSSTSLGRSPQWIPLHLWNLQRQRTRLEMRILPQQRRRPLSPLLHCRLVSLSPILSRKRIWQEE